ncbi:MAG: hypothetical protein QM817_26760 [Archangium sp.]
MNYVMEIGPLLGGKWVVFSLDENRQVHLCASDSRDTALSDVLQQLGGAPAHCCSSLWPLGEQHGWVRAEPPRIAQQIAAVMAASIENFLPHRPLPPPPMVDAWLRACAALVTASPAKHFTAKTRALDVHFDDGTKTARKLVGVLNRAEQPGLVITDSLEALLDERGTDGLPPNCLMLGLSLAPSPTALAIAQVYPRTFAPRLLRYRNGEAARIEDDELRELTGVLHAIAALCANRTGVGRAVVDQLEVIVLPRQPERHKQLLAS